MLYVKNLSRNATVKDLLPLFSRFQEKDVPPLRLRLLNGRMRGQAFLTFPSKYLATVGGPGRAGLFSPPLSLILWPAVSQAQEALELLNGFPLLGKPLILEFGRSGKPASALDSGINSALQDNNGRSDNS